MRDEREALIAGDPVFGRARRFDDDLRLAGAVGALEKQDLLPIFTACPERSERG